jgi:large subunit ribosomal protein L1
MIKLSKRMKEAGKLFGEDEVFSLDQAIENIAKFPKVKFDETVELHLFLNVNPKSSDQTIRGTVVLPNGLGKNVRVAVFCKGELEEKAKKAGAEYVGSDELIEKVSKGFLDFDVVVAAPDMMRDLSKLGKVLGPRGLMPTPKAGTVTLNIENAIKEAKAGKIEFKSDKQAGLHVSVGKRSFSKEKLLENTKCLIDAINNTKPATVKGILIKSASLTTTMGPGLKVAL